MNPDWIITGLGTFVVDLSCLISEPGALNGSMLGYNSPRYLCSGSKLCYYYYMYICAFVADIGCIISGLGTFVVDAGCVISSRGAFVANFWSFGGGHFDNYLLSDVSVDGNATKNVTNSLKR